MTVKRVPVKVVGVYAHKDEGVVANHFVLFKDEAKRRIPMFLGQFEAYGISIGLEAKAPDRPYTFDTMLTCLSVAGAMVEEAYINELKDEVFYALVSLRVGDKVHQIDMRPRACYGL